MQRSIKVKDSEDEELNFLTGEGALPRLQVYMCVCERVPAMCIFRISSKKSLLLKPKL